MKLEENNIIVKRSYKTVYKCDDSIVKVFNEEHPKSDVFNEALITARIEETGLDIPKVKGVSLVEGKWALEIEYKDGKTMEDMMNSDKKNIEKYMEDFVDLQLQIHGKTSPLLKGMKDKLARQINSLKDLDATTRYELLTRLESMPKHNKVCHGDFNPSNVIVVKNGKMTVVDWAHATQRKCKCGRGYDISSLCIERSGNSRSVFEIVLQKERYGKTVCTAVASDRGGSAAYKRQ